MLDKMITIQRKKNESQITEIVEKKPFDLDTEISDIFRHKPTKVNRPKPISLERIHTIKPKIVTDKTLKTIFGQSIYSRYGTGNIDLYAHDITITKGTGKAFLTIYSSKNTNIASLDDLKTIAGATFTKSCTGYINSKVIVAITETSFLLADGTTEALTGATFVDAPAAI